MRVWDIHPGYLNRQSLLGEHRELHGIVSIVVNRKKGYANHPETLRWVGYGWALRMRHSLLACEMALRGYTDKSPVSTRSKQEEWPGIYIDEPHVQFELLGEKYVGRENGRIPLPRNIQQLWRHHKYSVLARNQNLYRKIGRDVAAGKVSFEKLSRQLIEVLREAPTEGGVRNAVQHMWGYVSATGDYDAEKASLRQLLIETQNRAQEVNEPYLYESTALSELMVWIRK